MSPNLAPKSAVPQTSIIESLSAFEGRLRDVEQVLGLTLTRLVEPRPTAAIESSGKPEMSNVAFSLNRLGGSISNIEYLGKSIAEAVGS